MSIQVPTSHSPLIAWITHAAADAAAGGGVLVVAVRTLSHFIARSGL